MKNLLTRTLAPWLLAAAGLALSGCGSSAPEPSQPAAPAAPAAPATATKPPSTTAAPARSGLDFEADETGDRPAPDAETNTAPAAPDAGQKNVEQNAEAPGAAAPAAAASPEQTPTAPPQLPTGPEPRENIDYEVIATPQTLSAEAGKVEIAEVFSYTCPHCANLEAQLPAWKATLPAQINFVQVPMAHGPFEPLARGFYAAQAMGHGAQTHTGVFKAVIEERKIGNGKTEDVTRIYADLGLDPQALAATMQSFAVNAQIARNQKAVVGWAIESTPALVVAGKYRVLPREGGFERMLSTARWLAQRELVLQHEQASSQP